MVKHTPGRRLHLVDIENLTGGSDADENATRHAIERYLEVSQPGPSDHLVVASGRRLAPNAWFASPSGTRLLIGTGINGADKALVAAAPIHLIAARYYGVVIASGDSHFAPFAQQLQQLRIHVEVVARKGTVSRALAALANSYLPLETGNAAPGLPEEPSTRGRSRARPELQPLAV